MYLLDKLSDTTNRDWALVDTMFTKYIEDIDNSVQCSIYTDVSGHFPVAHVDTVIKVIKMK